MKRVRTTANALILRSLPYQRADTDTGKRLSSNQSALALGETFDRKWQFVQAPGGVGWASAEYLTEAPAIVAPATTGWPKVPHGRAQIVALFGEPCAARCFAGRVQLPAPLKLSWAAQRVTVFACHELLVPVFTSVFQEIHERGLWHLLQDFGGVYNCRPVKAGQKNSTHSWGIGIDLNTVTFPLGSKKKQDARLLEIFARHGFMNGAGWKRPDPMHWQYATAY